MPPGAGRLMCAAAEDMRLLMGLRLAVDDDRPLPYAASFAAWRLGLGRDKRRASRVIRALVRAGVVEEVGALPRIPDGPPNGTKLYAPPAGALEGRAVVVEVADRPPVQPAGEVEDEALVDGAEAVSLVDVGMPAVGDGASGTGGGLLEHGADDTSAGGGAGRGES